MSTSKKLLLGSVLSLLLIALGAVLLVRRSLGPLAGEINTTWLTLHQDQASALAKIVPQFLADQDVVIADGLLPAHASQLNDAGPWLNVQVPWSPATIPATPLTIDDSWKDRLKGNDHLRELAADVKLIIPSTAWMARLKEFDYWEIWASGPAADQKDPAHHNFMGSAAPDYLQLLEWAKFRLIRGLRENNLGAAVTENRQLARLIYSNELLVGEMVAIAIFATESPFQTEIRGAGITPFEHSHFDIYKRFFFGMIGTTLPFTPLNVLEDLSDAKKFPFGVCAAILENGEGTNFLRPFAHAINKDWYVAFEALMKARTDCRLTGLRPTWNNDLYIKRYYAGGPLKLISMLGSLREGVETSAADRLAMPSPGWINTIPPLRDTIGKMLSVIAIPNYFRFYQEQKK